MAKDKGGNGAGNTNNRPNRDKSAGAHRELARTEENRRKAQRTSMGKEFFLKQNEDKLSDVASFLRGIPGLYAFPGGDQPSVTVELLWGTSRLGELRELFVYFRSAHAGHPMAIGLKEGVYLKAKWLKANTFKSTAYNPAVQKTQDATSKYLKDFVGASLAFMKTEEEVLVDKPTKPETKSFAKKEADKPTFETRFKVEEEVVNEEKGRKTAKVKTLVEEKEVTILVSCSLRYTGNEWGYTPFAVLKDGLYLWQRKPGSVMTQKLLRSEEDGFIIVEVDKASKKFTTIAVNNEVAKVATTGGGYIGGMKTSAMIRLKEKLGVYLGGMTTTFTEKEETLLKAIQAQKAKEAAEAKVKQQAEEEARMQEQKAKEDARKGALRAEMLQRPQVIAYTENNQEVSGLPVKEGEDWQVLPLETAVILTDESGAPTTYFVVKGAFVGKPYQAKCLPVTKDRPALNPELKTFPEIPMNIAGEGEKEEQEIVLVLEQPDDIPALRKAGVNGGTLAVCPTNDKVRKGRFELISISHTGVKVIRMMPEGWVPSSM